MNFSISEDWNNSLILRYSPDKIIKIGKITLIKKNNLYICQNFFDFDINDFEFKKIMELINDNCQIRFSYLNDSMIKKLKDLDNNKICKIDYIDSWDAPILLLEDLPYNYFLKSNHSQIKRNYSYYKKNNNKYIFHNSCDEDILNLWNLVLNIDFNSWKKDENSDMKSLDREDLQYLSYMLKNPEKISLIVVCDLYERPLSYSLMFKGDNDYWYAVKWGASNEGRKLYVGFYALFNHIEYLYELSGYLNLDFWGRRNNTYDKLKNKSLKRNHIILCKGEKKDENN